MELKRLTTYITMALIFFLGSIEYVVILPTLYLYLENNFNAEQYFMGIVLAAFSFMGMVSSPICGFLSDRTKKNKFILMGAILFEIAGNIMYFIGLSKWMVLASRFTAGVSSGAEAVIFAELSRSSTIKQRTRLISLFIAVRELGIVIGPGFNFFLRLFDFYLGPFHIDHFTSPGMFMACLWILLEIAILCLYHGLPTVDEAGNIIDQAPDVDRGQTSALSQGLGDDCDVTNDGPGGHGSECVADSSRDAEGMLTARHEACIEYNNEGMLQCNDDSGGILQSKDDSGVQLWSQDSSGVILHSQDSSGVILKCTDDIGVNLQSTDDGALKYDGDLTKPLPKIGRSLDKSDSGSRTSFVSVESYGSNEETLSDDDKSFLSLPDAVEPWPRDGRARSHSDMSNLSARTVDSFHSLRSSQESSTLIEDAEEHMDPARAQGNLPGPRAAPPVCGDEEPVVVVKVGRWNHYGRLFLREDIVVILVVQFVLVFNQLSLETMTTPVLHQMLGWGEVGISLMYIGAGVEVITVYILVSYLSRYIQDRDMMVFGLSTLGLATVYLMWAIPDSPNRSNIVNIVKLSVGIFLDIMGIPFVFVGCVSLFSKKVDPEDQGLAQGVRRSVSGLGCILAPLWAGSTFSRPYLMLGVMAGLTLLTMVLLLLSYKRLFVPDVVTIDSTTDCRSESEDQTTPLLKHSDTRSTYASINSSARHDPRS